MISLFFLSNNRKDASDINARILKRLFSPEEAHIATALTMMPEPVAGIAQRTGRDAAVLADSLAALADSLGAFADPDAMPGPEAGEDEAGDGDDQQAGRREQTAVRLGRVQVVVVGHRHVGEVRAALAENGREDNTHFCRKGALAMAGLAVQGLRENKLPLIEALAP